MINYISNKAEHWIKNYCPQYPVYRNSFIFLNQWSNKELFVSLLLLHEGLFYNPWLKELQVSFLSYYKLLLALKRFLEHSTINWSQITKNKDN